LKGKISGLITCSITSRNSHVEKWHYKENRRALGITDNLNWFFPDVMRLWQPYIRQQSHRRKNKACMICIFPNEHDSRISKPHHRSYNYKFKCPALPRVQVKFKTAQYIKCFGPALLAVCTNLHGRLSIVRKCWSNILAPISIREVITSRCNSGKRLALGLYKNSFPT
jgi:hypothetical protein